MRNLKNEMDDHNKRSQSLKDGLKKAIESKQNNKGPIIVRSSEDPNKPIALEDKPKKVTPGEDKEHWGYHLLLDVSECNKGIDDEKTVVTFLKDLVKALKMKPIGEPIVVKVDEKEHGEPARGISAVQIITTSTITFHGDDDEWSAYIDIFSCAPYEPKVAINMIKKYFEPKNIGDLWLYRDAGSWPRKKSYKGK